MIRRNSGMIWQQHALVLCVPPRDYAAIRGNQRGRRQFIWTSDRGHPKPEDVSLCMGCRNILGFRCSPRGRRSDARRPGGAAGKLRADAGRGRRSCERVDRTKGYPQDQPNHQSCSARHARRLRGKSTLRRPAKRQNHSMTSRSKSIMRAKARISGRRLPTPSAR